MTAVADAKTVVEILVGAGRTNAQLVAIADAFAIAVLEGAPVRVRMPVPIHDNDPVRPQPIPVASLTTEQKAQYVLDVLRSFGREVVYRSRLSDELQTAEQTAAANAAAAASDFE